MEQKNKPKLSQYVREMQHKIAALTALNEELSDDNAALEKRVQKLERLVAKLITESKTVHNKHRFLKEHVNNMSAQLSNLQASAVKHSKPSQYSKW